MRGAARVCCVLILLLAVLSGCQSREKEEKQTYGYTAVLYPEYTHGSGRWESREIASQEAITAQRLGQGLSDMTGLVFHVGTDQLSDGTLTIDWALDSTLFSDYGERQHQGTGLSLGGDDLRWFMLDSMARTVQANLDIKSVYFTMDGGKALVLDGLYPSVDFWNMPYMGSAFYFSMVEKTAPN